MKFRYVTAGVMTGLAAGAIAIAPIAGAAANPSTITDNGRTTTVDKKGHNAIVVRPPTVSSPKIYGPFTNPGPIIFFD